MYIGTENWTGEKFCEVFGVKFISVCVVFMANLDVSLFKNQIINDILHSWNYEINNDKNMTLLNEWAN